MNIAIIPARSGSKGLLNKNIAKVTDKTLLEIAVLQAKACSSIDEVIVSTDSADYEILAVNAGAISLGLRPQYLSNDSAKTIDVIKDILNNTRLKDVDTVTLLQVTSPIRSCHEINAAVTLSKEKKESVVSVALVDEPHPHKMKLIKNQVLVPYIEGTTSEVNRQELCNIYQLTGAIYVSSVENIFSKSSFFSEYTIPLIQKEFVNIDSEKDLVWLRYLCDSRGYSF